MTTFDQTGECWIDTAEKQEPVVQEAMFQMWRRLRDGMPMVMEYPHAHCPWVHVQFVVALGWN